MTTPTPDPLDAIVAEVILSLRDKHPHLYSDWSDWSVPDVEEAIRAAVLADRQRRAAEVEAAARALIGRRKPVASDVGGMVLVGRDAYFALVAALDAAPARPEGEG